jgi:Leucine-rich repeat (LRR) protein
VKLIRFVAIVACSISLAVGCSTPSSPPTTPKPQESASNPESSTTGSTPNVPREQLDAAIKLLDPLGISYDELGDDAPLTTPLPTFSGANGVGGTELKKLVDLPFPFALRLNETKVTDEDLKELVKLEHLTYLNLGDCDITNSGIENLAAVPNLEVLFLENTKITDAGVPAFAKFKRLRAICLDKTEILSTPSM